MRKCLSAPDLKIWDEGFYGCLSLGGGVATLLVRTAQAEQGLGPIATLNDGGARMNGLTGGRQD